MSAPSQTPGAPAPGTYQGGPAATPPAPAHTTTSTTGQTGTSTTGGPMSNQNLNQIVGFLLYLVVSFHTDCVFVG